MGVAVLPTFWMYAREKSRVTSAHSIATNAPIAAAKASHAKRGTSRATLSFGLLVCLARAALNAAMAPNSDPTIPTSRSALPIVPIIR